MPTQVGVLEVDGGASGRPAGAPLGLQQAVGGDPMGVLDDVELVVTELVSNTVLHAPGPVEITPRQVGVRESARGGHRHVADRAGTAFHCLGGHDGLGLNLVEALSDAWGVGPRADGRTGKTVWCEFGQG